MISWFPQVEPVPIRSSVNDPSVTSVYNHGGHTFFSCSCNNSVILHFERWCHWLYRCYIDPNLPTLLKLEIFSSLFLSVNYIINDEMWKQSNLMLEILLSILILILIFCQIVSKQNASKFSWLHCCLYDMYCWLIFMLKILHYRLSFELDLLPECQSRMLPNFLHAAVFAGYLLPAYSL